MIRGDGNFVNASRQKVIMVAVKFNTVFSNGWNRIIADAATSPALAAVIPSSDARTALYFFRLLQKRITKKVRKVPGKKIPAADIIAPPIAPAMP